MARVFYCLCVFSHALLRAVALLVAAIGVALSLAAPVLARDRADMLSDNASGAKTPVTCPHFEQHAA
jgi:hypothetical protein